MSGRFEIEDWVAQDSSRVVFRAHDRESGTRVALRRLLPRGHGGTGLSEEEAKSFDSSMQLLEAVRAPGLRRVVGWGIDPIDRLPFHACEWVEGETLDEVLARGVLSVEAGRMLVEAALVAQVALDESGGGWQVATDPGSVIVAGGEQQFWFSFWVEAFPGPSAGSAVEGLASLAERAMGWKGRLSASNAGGGLASWVRMVREGRYSALEALSALRGVQEPEAQAGTPSQAPARPATNLSWTLPRRRKRVGLWVGAVASVLLLLSGGVWWIFGRDDGTGAGAAGGGVGSADPGSPAENQTGEAQAVPVDTRTAEVNARAAELARLAAAGNEVVIKDVYSPGEGSMLRRMLGREVALEGRLLEVRDSNSGKTRYLEFSPSRGLDDICGRYRVQDGAVPSLGELKPLEGRRVKIVGKIQIETGTGRVVLHLDRREQLMDLGPGALGTSGGRSGSGEGGKKRR